MKPLTTGTTLSTIALALCVCAASAQAGNESHSHDGAFETHSITVRYADLDLDSAAGLDTLYSRIERASRQVCGRADGRNLALAAQWRACRNEALDTAISRIENAQLSKLHRERDGAARQHSLVAAIGHDAG